MLNRMTQSALLISVFTGCLSAQAFAVDATKLMDRYKAAALSQGQKFSYDAITPTSGGFVVSGAVWQVPELSPIKSPELKFTGINETDGTVTIDRLEASAITSGGKDISVTFSSAFMENLRLPKDGAVKSIEQMAFYTAFEAKDGAVSYQGKQVAKLGSITINLSEYSATDPMNFTMNIADTWVDMRDVPNQQMLQQLAALGYDGKFDVSSAIIGSWNPVNGIMDLKQNSYTIKDVGTLNVTASMSGYTADTVLAMQNVSPEMSEADRQAVTMEAMQKVTFNDLAVSFKDDSITERGLKFASKSMNQEPAAIAQMAPMMVGMGMAQLQMPELTQMVQAAIGKFLTNPGTFTIGMSPIGGMKIMDMMSGAANPPAFVKSLNVQVTAE